MTLLFISRRNTFPERYESILKLDILKRLKKNPLLHNGENKTPSLFFENLFLCENSIFMLKDV